MEEASLESLKEQIGRLQCCVDGLEKLLRGTNGTPGLLETNRELRRQTEAMYQNLALIQRTLFGDPEKCTPGLWADVQQLKREHTPEEQAAQVLTWRWLGSKVGLPALNYVLAIFIAWMILKVFGI